MSEQQEKRCAVGPTVLLSLGALLGDIVMLKGLFGFYTSDLGWMLPVAVVGGICVFAAQKWAERL